MSDRYIGGEIEIRAADFLSRGGQSAWPDFGRAFGLRCDTGRSAIALALTDWRLSHPGAARVWVPSYVCDSVTDAVAKSGYDVTWYDDRPGRVLTEFPRPAVGDILIVIHYFGFPNAALTPLLQASREQGWGVIEDCVQAPYSAGVGQGGDYAVASLRKWWPGPDGAVARASHALTGELSPSDEKFVSMRTAAKLLRGEKRDEARYLALIETSEALLAPEPRLPSWLSGNLLEHAPVYAASQRRRKNWRTLQAGLENAPGLDPVFSALGDGVVPLAYPVLVRGGYRDALRRHFRAQNIFCPVHWPAMQGWPQPSIHLSQNILSLPLDQRYDAADMDRLVRVARAFPG